MKPNLKTKTGDIYKNQIREILRKTFTKPFRLFSLLSLTLLCFQPTGFGKPPKDIKKSVLSQDVRMGRIAQKTKEVTGTDAHPSLDKKNPKSKPLEPKKKNKNSKTKVVSAEDYLMSQEVAIPNAPTTDGVSIRISLNHQRAWIFQNGELANVSPVTTGKPGHRTPKGKFHVINKHRHWTSTIYKVPMPYFLRLNPGIFGLHQGKIHTNPASHGCIRLPEKQASEFFALASKGTPVWIED